MNWNSHIISEQELSAYANAPLQNFSSRIAALIAQQLATWPMLRNATEMLNKAEYKEFSVKGSKVLTQFNPARIVSTAAKVDAASINARPCFLCAENLPAEEKGIAFGENYIILCNPFPVLKNHLVISHKQHTPQAIGNKFGDFLDLTKAAGGEYFTLYNGPACGASAPDHHHFQACSRYGVPLFTELQYWEPSAVAACAGMTLVAYSSDNYRLNLTVARGDSKDNLMEWFTSLYFGKSPEPMMNVVATFDEQGWTIYLFPRAKHRPACYFAEGENQLTVSPAGIDLTGILVVPNPDHYARISAEDIAKIYSEITLPL